MKFAVWVKHRAIFVEVVDGYHSLMNQEIDAL
jgi:hypothetical protein